MKRLIALIMTLVMCFSFAACTKAPAQEEKKADTITIKDMMDREVEVPANTKENTVGATYGVATPFFTTLGISDRVLACNFKNKSFFRIVDKTIIGAEDIGNTELDAEALAALAPSIYICKGKPQDYDKIEAATKLGIPTLTISSEDPDEVMYCYEMLGKAFGVEERATEIVNYMKAELTNIDELAATIPEEERVTAMCMGSELGRVAGDDMLQTIMLKRVGAKTVVDDVAEDRWWVNVGVEDVFSRNPEYLFVTSSNVLDYKVAELYEDSSWSAMTAIKNHNVYVIPAKFDSWDMPGPGYILAMYFMMHCMYPDVIPTDMLQEKVDYFYEFLYGATITGEDIGYEF